MGNVFIIGSKGYNKNYGGWETFAKCLVDNFNGNIKFYVTEISIDDDEIYDINNVTCIKVKTSNYGKASMLLYTINSFKRVIKYIEDNNIENPIIYVLGLKLGPYLTLYKRKLKKLNIKVLVNPDGLEHKRSKWSWYVKLFFMYSMKTMLKNCDKIVCDSKGIMEYFSKYKDKTTYIAYGTDIVEVQNEKKVLKEYNLKSNDYYLVVGRFVPENNFETIIKEFMKTNTKKKLIIISNIEKNKFYDSLLENTKFDTDNRIILLNAIYDKSKLVVIRKNAYAYIHGHSVGGTNPSLLESLNVTNLNILYDCIFNKEVGKNSCYYFNKSNDNLKNLINNLDKLNKNEIISLGNECKNIIKNNYTWKIVVNKYNKLFKEVLDED